MKRKFLVAIAAVVVILAAFWTVFSGFDHISDAWMIHRGNAIVAKIEAYRVASGHLPKHLGDIGIPETEEGPFYYNRREGDFDLWYGKRLGESMSYDSKTKTWSDEG